MELNEHLVRDLERKGVDVALSRSILERWNSGAFAHQTISEARGVPKIDGKTVIDLRGDVSWESGKKETVQRLTSLGLALPSSAAAEGDTVRFGAEALREIGTELFASTAFGILNGGGATSFIDRKKNENFDSDAFAKYGGHFERLLELYRGKPKGITPAYINPDGSPGLSFLELKVRALLIRSTQVKKPARRPLPIFQMTSISTNEAIADSFAEIEMHDSVKSLLSSIGQDKLDIRTAVQPVICAFTHSSEGKQKRIFSQANGVENTCIPLPGGHGQNFFILAEIYRNLLAGGYKFAYLTNVDNLGALPDPVAIALLALSGKQAAFDFSFRTKLDVKGGILVRDASGNVTCADIGPVVSEKQVRELEESGEKILFNCATGLFNLERLVPILDRIAENLPTRFSDQDKDIGKYSQAEQVTWEVIGLLDDIMITAIEKEKRFLSAKLLMETLIASRVAGNVDFKDQNLTETCHSLERGLCRLLEGEYGMTLEGGRWIPKKD